MCVFVCLSACLLDCLQVYGFGARTRKEDGSMGTVDHCFPVVAKGATDNECRGVDGILQVSYRPHGWYSVRNGMSRKLGDLLFSCLRVRRSLLD